MYNYATYLFYIKEYIMKLSKYIIVNYSIYNNPYVRAVGNYDDPIRLNIMYTKHI